MITNIFIAIILAYLLGSISSAILVSKLFHLPDPRSIGSNNPGATNILRIGGKTAAIITLIGDLLKGFTAVMLAKQLQLLPIGIAFVMIAVILGHIFPIFFNFKGGKGVATNAGVLLAFNWQFGLLLLALWSLVVATTRISSLGAIISSLVAIYCGWWLFDNVYSIAISVIAGLLLWRHQDNIRRLLQNNEVKV